jgi:erythronate-4-phosphate dehydrogenase
LKIVIDQNIRAAAETFDQHGEVVRLNGRTISRSDLVDADALIVRSVTRVDAALLEGTPVGFVGTATIGTDHLDIPWLEANGITWTSAPGCNADPASQYTLAIAWLACERLGRSLYDQTVGVIGRGNVGSRVQRLFESLGLEVVANDPPLADRGEPGLVSQEEALACTIVCLHTPLTRDGPYPTFRMISEEQIARMPAGALLMNAGRGDVIDGEALMQALRAKRIHSALDVWPGEPRIDAELLEAVTVGTPHVAGYSDDGKRNGTLMVYDAFCVWADEPRSREAGHAGPGPELIVETGDDAVSRALEAACFVERHDQAMRRLAALDMEERAAAFDVLRRDYPPRRDFQAWRVHCPDDVSARRLKGLGFQADASEAIDLPAQPG